MAFNKFQGMVTGVGHESNLNPQMMASQGLATAEVKGQPGLPTDRGRGHQRIQPVAWRHLAQCQMPEHIPQALDIRLLLFPVGRLRARWTAPGRKEAGSQGQHQFRAGIRFGTRVRLSACCSLSASVINRVTGTGSEGAT